MLGPDQRVEKLPKTARVWEFVHTFLQRLTRHVFKWGKVDDPSWVRRMHGSAVHVQDNKNDASNRPAPSLLPHTLTGKLAETKIGEEIKLQSSDLGPRAVLQSNSRENASAVPSALRVEQPQDRGTLNPCEPHYGANCVASAEKSLCTL